MATTWGGAEAAKILGLSYWTLYSWDRSGLLKPSKRTGERQGARRHYNFADLLAARVIVRLRRAGAPTRRIRKALRELRVAREDLVRVGARLVAIDDDVKLIHDQRTLISLVKRPMQGEFRQIIEVDVAAEAAAIQRRIAEMEAA